ncbi:MAG: hypothetical protein AAF755_12395 [Pseudomonadota bacterium]
MAVARGASAAVDSVTLCTGNGIMTVYVDAEGQPTPLPHICPDSAILAAPNLADCPAAWQYNFPQEIAHPGLCLRHLVWDIWERPRSRAPPAVI